MAFARRWGGFLLAAVLGGPAQADESGDKLLAAAREGDLAAVTSLLDSGVDVNVRSQYGATPLTMAADQGQLEVAKLLIARGADVQAKDTFYKSTPITWAARNGQVEIVKLLAAHGGSKSDAMGIAVMSDRGAVVAALVELGEPADTPLNTAVLQDKASVVEALLKVAKFDQATLDKQLAAAQAAEKTEIAELFEKAGARPPASMELPRAKLEAYSGAYRAADGRSVELTHRFRTLSAAIDGAAARELAATSPTQFQASAGEELKLTIVLEGERPVAVLVTAGGATTRYERAAQAAPTARAPAPVAKPANWPMFRGPAASGVADGQDPPLEGDVGRKRNVGWSTNIPGLGHSCPVVWGDRVFLTSAESGNPDSEFKAGAYGDVDSVDDPTRHKFWVFCLDRHTGRVLWKQLAHEGVPRFKRHTKSSHANATPATDGKYLVVSFGAEGVYCYDLQGKRLWKLPMESINSGWFFQPDYEWGFGSSPILYGDWVILQCDSQRDSFLAAYELATGREVWRTARDEVPTWGTPALVRRVGADGKPADEIVTNGTRAIRGYDARTGRELWKLIGNSEITVPTPVTSDEFVFVTSGYTPIQPIYAIRPGGSGDLTLPSGQTSSQQVAWSKPKGGPYMPTPLVYQGLLYVIADGGVFSAYDVATGERVYQKRVGGQFTASPVAADGRIYLTSEEGRVTIVAAGREYSELGQLEAGETCLATPAICDGVLLVRTEHNLVALGKAKTPPAVETAKPACKPSCPPNCRPRVHRFRRWRS